MIPDNDVNKPAKNALPGYVGQRIYKSRVGDIASRSLQNAFAVPVGIKYIEEIRRTDNAYNNLKVLPDDWRDRILIGGEESSGLTTRGHITDKDGPWANLLVLDMLAYYGTRPEKPLGTLQEIWNELVNLPGLWESSALSSDPPHMPAAQTWTRRWKQKKPLLITILTCRIIPAGRLKIAGLNITLPRRIRYELVKCSSSDQRVDDHYYLRMRVLARAHQPYLHRSSGFASWAAHDG